MNTQNIILRSGESLTWEEVLEAFLLLARAEAHFPILSAHDAHLGCLMLIPDLLDYNEQEQIV